MKDRLGLDEDIISTKILPPRYNETGSDGTGVYKERMRVTRKGVWLFMR